ncbi:MAG TPA: hypothetical protein VFP59_00650 [Candidatus Angelobacter sp.]|nr:hypothetical protein [Candidatus Angelobacter sp.]
MRLKILNFILPSALLLLGLPAFAQSCQTRDEMAEQTRTALDNAAKQVFDHAVQGDVNSIRANLAPAYASAANDIASAVTGNKPAFQGTQAQIRTSFLLDTGATPSQQGAFYCGVFGTNGMAADGAEFAIPGISAGKYAIVIQDFIGPKGPYSFTTIFQEAGDWKLAGLRVRPESAAGHDGLWYLERAREFKTKGQNHNAWFYYLTSWHLLAPVDFMDTRLLSKITHESDAILPKDVPAGGKPVTFTANGKTYTITDMKVQDLDNSFDLAVKYSVPSTADFNATAADARSLATALVTQYPELKEIFDHIWAHAVDPNGGDVPGLITLKPTKTASARP